MERQIIPTADGSPTISLTDSGITYHSTHGAVQESLHIYIRAGLDAAFRQFKDVEIHLFEMGLGTGLNAYLSALAAEEQQRKIIYTAVEQFPLLPEESSRLNYANSPKEQQLFTAIHQQPWEQDIKLSEYFILRKEQRDLLATQLPQQFHLIYYDAFSPGHQPELWTQATFEQLYASLLPGGMLLTYCSKSVVRHAMIAAGFLVKKLPGPHGKRDILSAMKSKDETTAA